MEYSFENLEPIKVHPECIFIATANMGSSYTGTHKMDQALLDRFLIFNMEALGKDALVKAIVLEYKRRVKIEDVKTVVNVYEAINNLHDTFLISFRLSMRHLKHIIDLYINGVTIYDAFISLTSGIGGKESLEPVKKALLDNKITKE